MIKRINQFLAFLADNAFHLKTGLPAYQRRYQKLKKISSEKYDNPDFDIVYVLPPKKFQGWILDAICREIDAYFKGKSTFVNYPDPLPSSRSYFYSHYSYFRGVLLKQPLVLKGKNLLWYSHPKDFWFSQEDLLYSFEYADQIVSQSSIWARFLASEGVERITVAMTGADPNQFVPHVRRNGRIGFSSGYVPRKNGDRILELVKSMPDHEFELCGKKWTSWNRFAELNALSNFKYTDIPYDKYHEFYNSIDVFVSISEIEGGPVSLTEATMCNIVPVCSNTGHAADIISHGQNGYIFDVSAPISEIKSFILEALGSTYNVHESVKHLTWERFSHQVQEIAGLKK